MFETANYIEAALWATISIGFLVAAIRRNKETRTRLIWLAFVFLAFGISDVVEVQTGAWWRPWWLLIWKALCVLALFTEFVRYARQRKK